MRVGFFRKVLISVDVGELVFVGLQLVNGSHRLYRLQTVAVGISDEGHVPGAILLPLWYR